MSAREQLQADAWHERFARAADRLNDARWLLNVDAQLRAAQTSGERVAYAERSNSTTIAQRVGVFTGSFNPLTWGHVAVADAARARFQLNTLTWACSRTTVDKESVERATLLDRIAQVVALVQAEGRGDEVAVVSAGLYVDQVRAFRMALGEHVELLLIVGYDKIVQILDPRYYANRDASLGELFGLAELGVAPRAGADAHALAALLAQPANRPYAHAIHYLPADPAVAAVSSTSVRELARGCARRGADRLMPVTPPEGAALACSTSAYDMHMPPSTPKADRRDDAYLWRQRWLSALGAYAVPSAPRIDLRVLVEWTMEQSAQGERARAVLHPGPSQRGADGLDELLRHMSR